MAGASSSKFQCVREDVLYRSWFESRSRFFVFFFYKIVLIGWHPMVISPIHHTQHLT